jgi:hypothetical protein
MILLDTSVWIEFFKKNPNCFFDIKNQLDKNQILACSTIFSELLQGVKTEYEKKIILSYWNNLPHVNIDDSIMIDAGLYSLENKLIHKGVGLIDAILIVLAINNNATVWTLDKKLLKVIPFNFVFHN